METVSESFKNVIKSDTREIKGYVEIIYEDKDASSYVLSQAPKRERISLEKEIVDGIRKCKNYASLEENYTLLDGSFLLPNYNLKGDKSGYISEDLFVNIETPILKIESTGSIIMSSGITVYFQDNVIRDFVIILTKENDEEEIIKVSDNQKSIYQYIFTETISIKSLELRINKVEYSNRRIRIPEIDLGISQIYEGNDLVSFTTIEEVDLLVTSTPINICKVNLNNYDNMFDPINPMGLVKYLMGNTIINPFVGCLTTENGLEYVPMGNFYFKDWSSNANGNVTLNGENLIAKLNNLTLKSDGRLLTYRWTTDTLNEYLTDTYGYKFKLEIGTAYNHQLQNSNFMDFLQPNLLFQSSSNRYFCITRKNEAVLTSLNPKLTGNISRKELLEDVKYETKSILSNLTIKDFIDGWTASSTGKEDMLDQTYTLTSDEEYVWFKFSKYFGNYGEAVFSYSSTGNGKAELIDVSYFMAYVKFTGNPGDKIATHLIGYVYNNPPTQELKFTTNNVSGYSLNIDFTNNFNISNEQAKSIFNNLLKKDKKYKVYATYIGDPSYTPGDTVLIETRYGNKNIVITKHTLNFDGGLTGTIEGVGD